MSREAQLPFFGRSISYWKWIKMVIFHCHVSFHGGVGVAHITRAKWSLLMWKKGSHGQGQPRACPFSKLRFDTAICKRREQQPKSVELSEAPKKKGWFRRIPWSFCTDTYSFCACTWSITGFYKTSLCVKSSKVQDVLCQKTWVLQAFLGFWQWPVKLR